MLISTSFLSSKNIPKDLTKLNETETDYIHVDVMDGKFVKNKTMPFSEMSKIYKYTDKRLDIHLMCEDSSKYIKDYAKLNSEYITIHVESKNIKENLELIRSYYIKSGLAINPETPVKEIIPYLPITDLILVMSVEPGAGGQEFIKESEDKIKEIREILKEYKMDDKIISCDGGINKDTRKYVSKCDMIVSGSYIVNADDFDEAIKSLR